MIIAGIRMVESGGSAGYYRKIKKKRQELSVKPELQEQYEPKGFDVLKVLKTSEASPQTDELRLCEAVRW
jgi:hypothetical protein